jgi:hypothetical protein
VVHVGEAGGTLVSGLGKCGMGGFAEELHGTGAEAAQGFEGYRAKRIPGARVVCIVFPALVSIRAVILPVTLVYQQFIVQFSIYNLVGKLVSLE